MEIWNSFWQMYYKQSFLLHKVLIVGLVSCRLLWYIYTLYILFYCFQRFELWKHPFTVEDLLVSKLLLNIICLGDWSAWFPYSVRLIIVHYVSVFLSSLNRAFFAEVDWELWHIEGQEILRLINLFWFKANLIQICSEEETNLILHGQRVSTFSANFHVCLKY